MCKPHSGQHYVRIKIPSLLEKSSPFSRPCYWLQEELGTLSCSCPQGLLLLSTSLLFKWKRHAMFVLVPRAESVWGAVAKKCLPWFSCECLGFSSPFSSLMQYPGHCVYEGKHADHLGSLVLLENLLRELARELLLAQEQNKIHELKKQNLYSEKRNIISGQSNHAAQSKEYLLQSKSHYAQWSLLLMYRTAAFKGRY